MPDARALQPSNFNVNQPSPALVTQRAVQRLPRLVLLMFCAAYLLPGLFGRDPWKNADISAVGYMARLANGQTSWMSPELADLPALGGLLPYWLGAGSIKVLTPWVSLPMAARWPFALLLAATLALTWYACFHLAKQPKAQPVAFAFGGEAHPVDYARAIADGSVLALIAQLGLLQLGHETTPELVQLFGVALLLYGLASAPWRGWQSHGALLLAPALLASSGAPSTALALGLGGVILTLILPRQRSTDDATNARSGSEHRAGFPLHATASLLTGTALAGAVGIELDAWHVRVGDLTSALAFPRLFAWFAWPVWPMVVWTLWQWRRQLMQPHMALPLFCSAFSVLISIGMGANDRALMLALPSLAILAAFALPTLKRSFSAAIDWFSVLFFSGWALTFWVVYVSMHTGLPSTPARNVARLLPGFSPLFQPMALAFAAVGTLAWLWLVNWRTGEHRHPLWKSLVLPAGGVALNWLLATTLLLPPLDYARSYRAQMNALRAHLPQKACVVAGNLSRAETAALEVIGDWRVRPLRESAHCDWMLMSSKRMQEVVAPAGWRPVARKPRPSDKDDTLIVYRRS